MSEQEAKSPDSSVLPRESPWTWLPIGLLLAIWVEFQLTDTARFSFEPGHLLPVLAGWLASRFAARAIGLMLVLSVPGLLMIHFDPDEALQLSFGFATHTFLVSLFAFVAFARPRTLEPGALPILRPWWRWALWLAMCTLSLTVFTNPFGDYSGESLSMTWRMGGTLTLAILATAVRWSILLDAWRHHSRTRRRVEALFAVAFLIALLVGIHYAVGDGVLSFDFGLADPSSWLIALCFALTAFKILDWRVLIGLLALTFLSQVVVASHWETITEVLGFAPATDNEQLVVTGSGPDLSDRLFHLLNGASAALLGALISPFWRRQEVAPLHTWRTFAMLGAVLALQFSAMYANSGYVIYEPLVLGGAAFVCALVRGVKGMIAGPLIIQLCTALAYAALNDSFEVEVVTAMIRAGAITFPFAFFGLLARRYDRSPQVVPAAATTTVPAGASVAP